MNRTIFLKLGGSLLTDKTGIEALRLDVLHRLAAEIAAARAQTTFRLVLGHGSGSFGHVAAARYGTRRGVDKPDQWYGFAEVADTAARLNRHVVAALLAAGVPAMGLQPSASARCEDGRIVSLSHQAVQDGLAAGLVPVIYGDVAFDSVRGGTIVSTEEVMDFLARAMRPSWMLLAGEMNGVLDGEGRVISHITRRTLPDIMPMLGGSRGTDVTGGMAAKVEAMMALSADLPGMATRIFNGLQPDVLRDLLVDPALPIGTFLQ